MGNLSAMFPETSETVKRIYAWHKEMGDAEESRGYLGASIIGHPCERYLWYSFRWCVKPEFDGRMYRLFETGHLAEERFIRELRAIGCKVYDQNEDGEQFEITCHGGHFKSHMDGCAIDISEAPKTWHVLEFKTHNAKSFAKLKKEGVKAANPQHYAQVMIEMGLTSMKRALYMAVNKDTDELYSERIRYNADEFRGLLERAERVIMAQQAPERCADRPDDFRCRFCDAYDLCWGTGKAPVPLPSKTCRTCCHATPEVDDGRAWARWSCRKHSADIIPKHGQVKACEHHLLLPCLVSLADAVDAGDDYIEYCNREDGAIWHAGSPDVSRWSTDELMIEGPGPMEQSVRAAKEGLAGSTVKKG